MNGAVADSRRARRCELRHPVVLEAKVLVDRADGGGLALAARGTIEDLSLNGARVRIQTLTKGHVLSLALVRYKCSVVCHLPGIAVPSMLLGDVAWMNVSLQSAQPAVSLGVHLTDMLPRERNGLARFLNQLAHAE